MQTDPRFAQRGGPMLVVRDAHSYRPGGFATHTEHVLGYLVDGSVRMVSGAAIEAHTGDALLIPAGVPHRSLGGDADRWTVGFCASCLRLDEEHPLMRPFRAVRCGAVPVLPIARGRRRRLARLFREMKEECERNAPESPELARSLLLLLLGELCRAMPQATHPSSLVAEALAVIQRRAFEPISLRDVAAAVHRTPAHVASEVKTATGYTVGDWLRAARVAEAAAWLAHSDETLDAIAERVGWRDKTHFIRQFRKVHGETPAAWRRARRHSPKRADTTSRSAHTAPSSKPSP